SFHGKGWSDYASCFEYFSYVRQRGSFEYIFGEATRGLDSGDSVSTIRQEACLSSQPIHSDPAPPWRTARVFITVSHSEMKR
ncbi:MAG: hypothetical protein ABIL25_09770, partial [candidate division WOR-3 bacterium]